MGASLSSSVSADAPRRVTRGRQNRAGADRRRPSPRRSALVMAIHGLRRASAPKRQRTTKEHLTPPPLLRLNVTDTRQRGRELSVPVGANDHPTYACLPKSQRCAAARSNARRERPRALKQQGSRAGPRLMKEGRAGSGVQAAGEPSRLKRPGSSGAEPLERPCSRRAGQVQAPGRRGAQQAQAPRQQESRAGSSAQAVGESSRFKSSATRGEEPLLHPIDKHLKHANKSRPALTFKTHANSTSGPNLS